MRVLLVGLGDAESVAIQVLGARAHEIAVCATDAIGPRCLEETYDVVVDRWPGTDRSVLVSRAASACGGAFILTVMDGPPDQGITEALLAAGADDVIARSSFADRLVERILVAEQAVFRRSSRSKAEAATVRDIAAQLEQQERVRDVAENLSATLNSIGDAVIVLGADGKITRMNPVAEKLTTWAFAEAHGRSVEDLFKIVDGRTRAAVESPVTRALRKGTAVALGIHAVLVRRDGTELPIADSCAPIKGTDDLVRGVVLVFRDVSAEHRARELEEKSRRQLFMAERMASVGTLAAGAAHEINNPLGYVISNLDIALEDIRALSDRPTPARLGELEEMLRQARGGAERVRHIVRGLKTFSHGEEERRTTLALRPTLELAANVAANEIRHRARLVTNFGATPLVEADEARLVQLFVNLLVNAAQALPDGQSETNEIRLTTSTDAAGRAIIEIKDTGPGIPSTIVGRIFDPFFTTKAVGLGAGLGLAVSHNIAKSMGGGIEVQSEEGKGTTFRVVLPPAAVQRATGAVHSTNPPATRTADVLFVDDEVALGAAFRRILRRHDVTVVSRAREALDLLATGKTFDVIFSDIMMPEMSGIDFYDEAMRRFPEAAERMVFVTGNAFTPQAKAFLARVSNERVEKPFDPERVRSLVSGFSEKRRAPVESGTIELRSKKSGDTATR